MERVNNLQYAREVIMHYGPDVHAWWISVGELADLLEELEMYKQAADDRDTEYTRRINDPRGG